MMLRRVGSLMLITSFFIMLSIGYANVFGLPVGRLRFGVKDDPFSPYRAPLDVNKTYNKISLWESANYEINIEYMGNESSIINYMLFDAANFEKWLRVEEAEPLINRTILLNSYNKIVEFDFSIPISNYYVLVVRNIGTSPFYGIIVTKQVSFDFCRFNFAIWTGVLGIVLIFIGYFKSRLEKSMV
ncbi:MAG: hypothetical protein NDF55_02250 [archaeon GB-1867-005]|nr:hypothetical protein [Candidatus Culexmicrobium cathedralense]